MYKYSLHKKSIKHHCPNCKKKSLVLYIDVESEEYLSSQVGRCDREINCGYHYSPKSYFHDNNKEYVSTIKARQLSVQQVEISIHDEEELLNTLRYYNENNFVQFLKSKFDIQEVEIMLNEYRVGTANFWNFGTVFWQVDSKHNIRGGKVIIYNTSGKRTKYINWIHSIKIKSNQINTFNLSQCFFGEHLINNCNTIVAIVESEKTACIMSMLFKKYTWLAAGSLNGLNDFKMEVLRNRRIVLYPDLGINGLNGSPFSIWNSKCEYFKKIGFDIEISDLLERNGTNIERENGYDIADYFLKNIKYVPTAIVSNQQKIVDKLYLKNKNLKILIDIFDLTDQYENPISLSPIG